MELDRKTVTELVLSATVFFAFIGAVFVASQSFAAPTMTTANFSGQVQGEVVDADTGRFTGEVTGTVSGSLEGTVSGTVNGTVEGVSGSFTADVNGTVRGELPDSGDEAAPFTGTLNGTLADGTDGTLSGEVTGEVRPNATISPRVTADAGLVMVGLIGAFILLMALVGLWMYREDFDDE